MLATHRNIGNRLSVRFGTVQRFEAGGIALAEHQCQVRTGQHDRFASIDVGQGSSCLHEHLSMFWSRDPGTGHRYVGLVHLLKIVDRRNDFHALEYTVEVRFHHHAGSKQADSSESTPFHFK